MKNCKKKSGVFLILLMLICIFKAGIPVYADNATDIKETTEQDQTNTDGAIEDAPDVPVIKNGWVEENNAWYYYKNGTLIKNRLLNLDDGIYFVDKKGIRQYGWQTFRDKTYYFNEDGKAQLGWMQQGNDWYYFNQQKGYLYKDIKLISVSGKIYIFGRDGKRCKGWCEHQGQTYFIGSGGYALQGMYRIGKNYYYFHAKSGYLYKNRLVKMTNGYIYYFDKNGIRFNKGFKNIRTDGKINTYYFLGNGKAVKGWRRINGKWYFFDEKERTMVKNKTIKTSDGTVYRFDSKGVCLNKK